MIKENTVKEKAFEAWCKSGLETIGVAIDLDHNKILVTPADKITGEIVGYYDNRSHEEDITEDLKHELKKLNLYLPRDRGH